MSISVQAQRFFNQAISHSFTFVECYKKVTGKLAVPMLALGISAGMVKLFPQIVGTRSALDTAVFTAVAGAVYNCVQRTLAENEVAFPYSQTKKLAPYAIAALTTAGVFSPLFSLKVRPIRTCIITAIAFGISSYALRQMPTSF